MNLYNPVSTILQQHFWKNNNDIDNIIFKAFDYCTVNSSIKPSHEDLFNRVISL